MSGFTALAAQAIALLALVSLVGIVIGWSFGSLSTHRRITGQYESQLGSALRNLSDAEGELLTLRTKLQDYESKTMSQDREHESREHLLAALEARLAEAESAAADARRGEGGRPPLTAVPSGTDVRPNGRLDSVAKIVKDDLTRIKGIGKTTEQTLNTMGITLFEQLAALTDEEVDSIDEALGAFPGRIRRDGWVASAAKLHKSAQASGEAR